MAAALIVKIPIVGRRIAVIIANIFFMLIITSFGF